MSHDLLVEKIWKQHDALIRLGHDIWRLEEELEYEMGNSKFYARYNELLGYDKDRIMDLITGKEEVSYDDTGLPDETREHCMDLIMRISTIEVKCKAYRVDKLLGEQDLRDYRERATSIQKEYKELKSKIHDALRGINLAHAISLSLEGYLDVVTSTFNRKLP